MPKTAAQSPDAGPDDATLIEQVLLGETASFEGLMRRYNQRLFRVARSILRDDAEAEDAVQQAYLSAYEALPKFRGDARFSTWITRIVVNEALRRTRKRQTIADPTVPVVELVESSPEDRVSQQELRELLEAAIDELPSTYRMVFVMRDVQEMSTREASECLDVSEEVVRVRLHRARRTLRERLIERIDTQAGDAFHFAGEQCNRIVARVLEKLTLPIVKT